MHRLFRLTLLLVLVSILALSESFADQIYVSGRLAPGQVRVFLKDNTYIINRDYVIGGTLIIEPGTTVKFYPQGRIIDSVGGRIIADGFAKATYNANPGGIDPIATPGSSQNMPGFSGYADLKYFLYAGTSSVQSTRDLTVHPQKYDHIFNVTLDTAARQIKDLTLSEIGVPLLVNRVIIPFEQAFMFTAARLEIDPNNDINLNIKPWSRLGAKSPNVTDGKIYFRGQPENNFSREWGHILVLPGARAAFFRNVVFEGFRKDTTVDRTAIYDNNQTNADWPAINNAMRLLTNGGGGVITTFSSRTWILNCEFNNNMARYRGGAIQFLQTPDGFPISDDGEGGTPVSNLDSWSGDKNPNYTEADGSISRINTQYARPAIDLIDEPTKEPITAYNRQAYDDGRLSIYLGRFRNNKFSNNRVQLSNVGTRMIGTPPVQVTTDLTDEPARFPIEYGNSASGGAIYIAGKDGQPGEDSQIEIGLGVNNSINTSYGTVTFPAPDAFEATGNIASNYQNAGSTKGARGGAIFLGAYTSMIVAGKYNNNETYTKYLQDSLTGTNNGFYSRGGAIFTDNTYGRLTVRGGPNRDMIPNVTEFVQNKSGSGGAIFVDGNTDRNMSPVIGGSDTYPWTRDYGYNIKFVENSAICYGGAITSMRNLRINGSGGVEANALIGYGGYHPVNFLKNTAGYAGGALNITIPSNQLVYMLPSQRAVSIIRAEFRENVVGSDIAQRNKPFIRGGGAIYSLNADLNVVKSAEFIKNKVYNGNGGAIALIHPETSMKRYFLSDVDVIDYNEDGVGSGFTSTDEVLTYRSSAYPPDARMLTRFTENEIILDQDLLKSQSGTGTTQIGWGTRGTPSNLFGVHFINQYNGFAVGMNGTIVKITLGGSKWVYKNYPTPYRLIDVWFTTANTGFIVGDRGVILKTTNTGNDWYEVRPALDNFRLNSVMFSGTLIGFAVGERGKIFKTTDGGDTWFDPTMANYTNNNLNSVYFTGTNRGFAVGDRGTIITTANGGVTWDVKSANTLSNFRTIYFVTSDTGFVAGSAGVIYKTNDGGNSWNRVFEDPTKSFFAMQFTDTRIGYVVGEFGIMMKTTDQGRNWNAISPETSYSLYDMTFPTSSTGFIVGEYGLIKKTTNAGMSWEEIIPADISYIDVKRFHQEINLPENGIGLGGAIYILDSVTANRTGRSDTIAFNRVRMQNNKSFTGAAIYSDNYDLKLLFSRSLVTGNEAYSGIGFDQNYITGAVIKDPLDTSLDKRTIANFASSDLAGAIIYGEIQGPLPSGNSNWAANSIYNNFARFEIRLPDAPNTKGILAGTTGIGYGGTDTLRGNYWGHTEANVDLIVGNRKIKNINGTDTLWFDDAVTSTFFVESQFNPRTETYMQFLFSNDPQSLADPRNQGPFESRERFTYKPIRNANLANDETKPCADCMPEKVTMAGLVYDSYDKGTDIKTADYNDRRMSPIEDFTVGIPPIVRRFNAPANANNPSFNKYVKRWTRDPFVAEAKDNLGNLKYPEIAKLQDEFRPAKDGNYYHPIGYPMYLEAQVDYNSLAELTNHDPRLLNESVFFVINETTGDFIRVNMRQVSEDASNREIFRTRVELIPDSTNILPNTTIRRTTEGLFNLGTGDYLLRNLQQNPFNEDRATMPGRRYHAGTNALAKVSDLFSNRPAMPVANSGNQTYFAGERYNAIPADTGDVIRIVSRTVLWREGVIPAYDDGISFKVVRSTEPPVFTGNIVSLSTDTIVKIVPSEYPWKRAAGIMDTLRITEFLNRIFVTEDREYPQPEGTYNIEGNSDRGRDSILTVTAMDTNKYFDPRSLYFPDQYAQLSYEWYVSPESGLSRWLMTDLIPAGDNTVQNPRDNAQGYLIFRGRPMNPYVVPGGEDVYVKVSTFPPHYRNVDYLKAIGMTEDQIAKWVTIFPQYLHANVYDSTNARFLQQDTIDIGANYSINYAFKLFVIDSVPKFLPPDFPEETVRRRINRAGDMVDYIVYKPSVYTCGQTQTGMLKANMAGIDDATTKLRFMADFNTDDEMEDDWAVNWDFRYGKTAYGFMNVGLRNNDGNGRGSDTTVIDTTTYDGKGNGRKDVSVITQTRPGWMNNTYIYKYGSETNSDTYGVDFTTHGQINIRVDKPTALGLLKPLVQNNGAMITDTVFTVVVNDGHGGLNFMSMPIFINYQPTIITESLPSAKEDIDYNPELLDSLKMIHVYDPNFDQDHVFELVYDNYADNEVFADVCYPEAGSFDLANLKTTPKWLKINPMSGLLYGTPGVMDAPKQEKVTVIVWDLVDGEKQLAHVKSFDITVDSTNHRPHIMAAPLVRCIDKGSAYVDTLKVTDWDLQRNEVITIKVVQPSTGFTVEPANVSGPKTLAEVEKGFTVKVKASSFDATPDPDGKVTIKVVVTDASGMTDEITYRLKYSEETDFICPITIENSKGGIQAMQFGTAPKDATTGDGLDGEPIGTLDNQFCEYELPPQPQKDVFDARWTVPNTNGTLRDIFPRAKTNVQDIRIYKGIFQAGGVTGSGSLNYPIYIRWNKNDIPAKDDTKRNPTGSQWFIRDAGSNGNVFHYNMKTGAGNPQTGEISITELNNVFTIQINRDAIDAFVIIHDWASGVNDNTAQFETGISAVQPNPIDKSAQIQFGLSVAGKVRMEVIDELGKVVSVVTDDNFEAGSHTIDWTAINFAGAPLVSGSYTLRMIAGSMNSTKSLIIVK